MTKRALPRIFLLASLAASGCQDSNTVAGPNSTGPTPTPTPAAPSIEIAGDWTGIYQADPTKCQTSNLAAATASFTASGTTLNGNLTSMTSNCPIAVRLQAVRNGNTFSGSASQLGYTGNVRGHFEGTDLIVEVTVLANATSSIPGGMAQLHRPSRSSGARHRGQS